MLNFTPSVQRLGCGNQNVNITKMWKYTCPTRMYAMRNSYKIFRVCGHFQANLLNMAGFAQGVPTLWRFNLKDALRLHCPRNFQCPSSESICQIQKSFWDTKMVWTSIPSYLHHAEYGGAWTLHAASGKKVRLFGRPFVKRFALSYRTVVCLFSL